MENEIETKQQTKRTTSEAKVEDTVEKSLQNTDQDTCKKNVSDVVIFGDNLFKLLSKASSRKEGWMKSTKCMMVGTTATIQVTTQQRNPDGSYVVAEALTTMENVVLNENFDTNGVCTGRYLTPKLR